MHYFKFCPGTKKVEHGTLAFNFDIEYYENKFKNSKVGLVEEDDVCEFTTEKRDEYMYNLIYDPNIKWNTYILDTDISLSLYMSLLGRRPEDMKNNPEKYSDIIKELLLKR